MESSRPGVSPAADSAEAHRKPTAREARAERLIGEYLRVWGLRDPQTLAKLSRHWVRQASESLKPSQSHAGHGELDIAVLRLANEDIGHWLDHLNSAVCADSHHAWGCRG